MAEENTNITAQEQGGAAEKTFTQAEVDALIARRVTRALKGMPDEEELNSFRSWQKDRNTERETINSLTTERDTANTALAAANSKLEQYERERYLLAKGVKADDVDYYAYKIGKLVTKDKNFEQAAEEYLADKNPTREESNGKQTVSFDTAASVGQGKTAEMSLNERMNRKLRGL